MNAKHSLAIGAFVAAMAVSSGIADAEDATLQGRVVTPDGRTAIKNFPVIVRGKEGSVVATTDEDGKYEVHDLPPGRYEVVPANEPTLRQEVIVKPDRRFWQIWKRDAGKPTKAEDIHLRAGKRY